MTFSESVRSSQPGERAQARLLLLMAVLFVAYLCVAIPLPIVPIEVTARMGFGDASAGLAVGVAFFSTILTRPWAGALIDRRGVKVAVTRGLGVYAVGALISALAGLPALAPLTAYLILLAGRLALGIGESLVGVGIVAWGIGLLGVARSGKVLALVGAAIYGALAVGGPVGLALLNKLGFAGAMIVSAVLPCVGLLAIAPLAGLAPHPPEARTPFLSVMTRIWRHGLIVAAQGVGFAAIGAFFALSFLSRNWSHAGLGLSAFGGGFVLVRIFGGHLPDRLGALPVAIVSLGVEAVGQILIASAGAPGVALLGAFLTGLGCSLVFPAMGREVVRLVEPRLRGAALGGFTAFQDLAYGLTGPAAGLLADRAGYSVVFWIGGGAAVLGLLNALFLPRRPSNASG
jgi:MFS family permease